MSEHCNVVDYLLRGKEEGRVAISALSGRYTYADLQQGATKIARSLLERGVRKGDRVLLIAENSFFWIAGYLGTLRIGAVVVPLPPTTLAKELTFYLEHTEARCLIATEDLRRKCGAVLGDLPVISEASRAGQVPTQGDAAAETEDSSEERADWPEVRADDLAALMFTSGSTGQPRAVMISHGNIVANSESIIEALSITSDDRMMTVLPMHYCFGTSLLHTHLRAGAQLVLDTRFTFPELILRRMQDTECTSFAGVPSHYQILLRNSSIRSKALPKLRSLQQAGGHLAPRFLRELQEILPAAKINVMYGQTEATARLAYLPPSDLQSRMGSIGKAVPGVTLRLLDEAGNDVPAGQMGEIVAEGANISQGYWRSPEETAFSFRAGRLHTGDLAIRDGDYLYVVDRAKDFIKCGGKRVSIVQIEDSLQEFDFIIEAAVIAIPDDVLGEAVKAFIVPKDPGQPELLKLFSTFCKASMAPSLVPKEIVMLEALPKNNAGKVLRQALKSLHAMSDCGQQPAQPSFVSQFRDVPQLYKETHANDILSLS